MEGIPFGHYRLLELLGRGGMGEVWRAFDTEADRIVAVKVLTAHLAEDVHFQQRFRREAKAAAGLNEPHVVPIHRYGEINGQLYVDMRLIEGRDLESILHQGPLAPPRAVKIVDQVASALNAAHRIGLVHRDVKPSNILIAENDFAYLIDFGIARTVEDAKLTNTGTTIGTWAYMAPERFTTGAVDARCDVYALACVLHQALTGRRPYPGDSMEQQIAGHLTTPPPRPSMLRQGMPTALDGVIATGMAKNPHQRYASTTELARAASAAVTQPIPRGAAGFPPPPPPPRAPAAPQQRVGFADLPTGVDPGPRTAFAPWVSGPPPQPSPTGTRRPWWQRPVALFAAAVLAIVLAAVVTFVAVGRDDGASVNTAESSRTSVKSTTTTTTTKAPVNIDSLLPSVEQINTIMGATAMTVNRGGTGLLEDEADVTPPECHGAVLIVSQVEFASTNVAETRWQSLKEPGTSATHSVIFAVVRTASVDDAKSYFDNEARVWQACDGKPVTTTDKASGQAITQTLSNFVQRDDLITMVTTANGVNCQRALGIKDDVLADASACYLGPIGSQGEAIVTDILARAAA